MTKVHADTKDRDQTKAKLKNACVKGNPTLPQFNTNGFFLGFLGENMHFEWENAFQHKIMFLPEKRY